MSDEPPDPLASLDQVLRGLIDIARVVRSYYTALLEQGFTDVQALELTAAFQTQMQRGPE